nr:uncharacterized protein LOC129160008 [Nothobranchius furzeri]
MSCTSSAHPPALRSSIVAFCDFRGRAQTTHQTNANYAWKQEVLQEPPIPEFQSRWPALFDVSEINLEFMRLTTIPLTSKFLGELDRQTDNLMKVFNSKGGAAGRKMAAIMAQMDNNEDINVRRDCVLSCLSIYLNEDLDTLVKEHMDIDSREAEADITEKTMGIYTVRAEGHGPDGPGDGRFADVGVVLEGVEVLHSLQCQPFMRDALWTDLCTQLELSKKPEAYIRGVPENPDGPGLNQTVTKSAGTETQIAPVIWLTVMHLHSPYIMCLMLFPSQTGSCAELNPLVLKGCVRKIPV